MENEGLKKLMSEKVNDALNGVAEISGITRPQYTLTCDTYDEQLEMAWVLVKAKFTLDTANVTAVVSVDYQKTFGMKPTVSYSITMERIWKANPNIAPKFTSSAKIAQTASGRVTPAIVALVAKRLNDFLVVFYGKDGEPRGGLLR